MTHKMGIATTGGGTRAIFTAGVLHGLATELKFTQPHVVVASSGSSGIAAYYVAGQQGNSGEEWVNISTNPNVTCYVRREQGGDIRAKWVDISSDKNFASIKKFPRVLDVDYLIDVLVKQRYPLDVDAIRKSNTKLFVATTDFDTGEAVYFGNQDNIFEALRASKAAPFFYGKTVEIDGRRFIDGQIASGLEQNIQKAVDEGAERVLAIDTSLNCFWRKSFLRGYALGKSPGLKRTIKESCDESFRHSGGEFLYVGMKDTVLKASVNPRDALARTYDRGLEYVRRNRESLSDFLEI